MKERERERTPIAEELGLTQFQKVTPETIELAPFVALRVAGYFTAAAALHRHSQEALNNRSSRQEAISHQEVANSWKEAVASATGDHPNWNPLKTMFVECSVSAAIASGLTKNTSERITELSNLAIGLGNLAASLPVSTPPAS